jgi:hypothetical protein
MVVKYAEVFLECSSDTYRRRRRRRLSIILALVKDNKIGRSFLA